MTKIILSLLTLVSMLVSGLLTTNVSALSVDNTATATYDKALTLVVNNPDTNILTSVKSDKIILVISCNITQ